MLFDGLSFKARESALSALTLKQQVILNNLSNMETPGFKQQEVLFSNVLEKAQDGTTTYNFKATVNTAETTVINIDGNNVDTDQQSLELYRTYLHHAAIVDSINTHFGRLRTVINANI